MDVERESTFGAPVDLRTSSSRAKTTGDKTFHPKPPFDNT